MATTTNIEKMTRTAREMAEVQRDSYEALAESFTASQRRGARLAQDGLKFFKLQEDNARAAQEWFANGVRLMQLQQRNADFAQSWLSGGVEALREQTEQNLRAADAVMRNARKQQEGLQAIGQQWAGAYQDFFTPFASYAREGLRTAQQATEQEMQATQQVAEQGIQATRQATQQGLRVAEETAEQTEKVLQETEKATHEAELQAAVYGALKTTDYESLNVDEVSKRLDGLSAEQLRKVREFEKNNKSRETLIEQIDRKIKAAS
ncbi:MAG: hypothetical protein AVDCRST_MAG01-01-2690 [uncultured Rubrobacteraceae bacterium]|uniref:Uncharacterized protein n=1 Tax=uncultured Rubrobacteraceae bacterium TaxID=349277 RepID=A0A6J4Q461_9ACTN|nr:MAG: hypothetical protein AVDCRST_MAG01-01-2690 [uncultured Rubrobacteraceae bacterium]